MADEAPIEGQPAEGATPTPADVLGENGKKALEAERKARAAAEKLAADREAKLREYEDRDKSEEQKRQEERDRLERELADLTAAKTRAEVSASTSVPLDVLAGPKSASTEHLQEYATLLTAWRGDQAPQRLVVPGEGGAPPLALNSDGLESALKQALGIN
jgi:crotonobetainyl-CoA:carnitine CoA-transferase CaiB-like acyl-CoA transferase